MLHLDWVQWVTIVLVVLCLVSLLRHAAGGVEGDFWPVAVFCVVLFIPFARVLRII